jgi:vesicle-fusing ATPase
MSRNFIKAFNGLVFSPSQILVFDFHGQNLNAVVKGIGHIELAANQQKPGSGRSAAPAGAFGILMEQTDVNWMKAPDSAIKIKNSARK